MTSINVSRRSIHQLGCFVLGFFPRATMRQPAIQPAIQKKHLTYLLTRYTTYLCCRADSMKQKTSSHQKGCTLNPKRPTSLPRVVPNWGSAIRIGAPIIRTHPLRMSAIFIIIIIFFSLPLLYCFVSLLSVTGRSHDPDLQSALWLLLA